LVDLTDPSRVHYYGADIGTSAFTSRCDPDDGHTNFGRWNSMRSAFDRLDQFSGPDVDLALTVFDSVPALALTALSAYVPQVLPESEFLAIEPACTRQEPTLGVEARA
jgi:hypothetical protein